MAESSLLARVANRVIGGVLRDGYYPFAAQRRLAERTAPTPIDDALVLMRGMLRYEPAEPFLTTLRRGGFPPQVFRFSNGLEENHLTAWETDAAALIRHYTENTEAIGRRPVFVGHSAGGLQVYLLAAIARGGDLEASRWGIRGIEDLSPHQLESLRGKLQGAHFIGIAAPFNGIRFTPSGRVLNDLIVEPRAPGLFSSMTTERLEKLYAAIGKRPDEVIDANIVGDSEDLGLEGGLVSLAVNALVQAGMRAFSPFIDHGERNDGIVPMEAAMLVRPPQRILSFDHLKLVEREEPAHVLLSLIRDLRGIRPPA